MFTGSIVAIVTPMDEKGNVCRASLKKLIDYHVASGTSAIVSVGTTGESATLNHDEHADVVMMTLELADGRIPVIAGTGANATAEAISLTQRFNDSGIVGCLTVTPYYNRPSQEGLYQHFKAIAEHTDLPQIQPRQGRLRDSEAALLFRFRQRFRDLRKAFRPRRFQHFPSCFLPRFR